MDSRPPGSTANDFADVLQEIRSELERARKERKRAHENIHYQHAVAAVYQLHKVISEHWATTPAMEEKCKSQEQTESFLQRFATECGMPYSEFVFLGQHGRGRQFDAIPYEFSSPDGFETLLNAVYRPVHIRTNPVGQRVCRYARSMLNYARTQELLSKVFSSDMDALRCACFST